MTFGEIIAGQRQKWSLLKRLGEGDAGEVYLVESLLDRKEAILKRPYRSTFTSDILRQAEQIRVEGRILKALQEALSSFRTSTLLRAPLLLDQSPAGKEFGEQFFLILEKAPGFDLNTLAHIARSGQFETSDADRLEDHLFLERIAQRGDVQELVLLRALSGLVDLFERIHFSEISGEREKQYGILWNDVKPEHVYWDPTSASLTIIDWGNGQLLEADGATEDRHYSLVDDYYQFLQEMGKFLEETNLPLYERLEWPQDVARGNAYLGEVKPLKERLDVLLEEALAQLREARRREEDHLGKQVPTREDIQELQDLQDFLLDCGVIPDFQGLERFYGRLATSLIGEGSLEELRQVSKEAVQLPSAPNDKWRLIELLAERVAEVDGAGRKTMLTALHSASVHAWPEMLWDLLKASPEGPFPDWWDEASQLARQLHLQLDADVLTPYVVVARLYFTLQASVLRQAPDPAPLSPAGLSPETVLRMFEEEVVKKWKQLEPTPPNSGIEYRDVESLVDEIEALLPGTKESLTKALAQPKAQASIIMDAWRNKEFEKASRGLRSLLVWDPHRRRLLLAEQAMQSAQSWLLRMRQGASSEQAFADYLMEVEFTGRELRNQVGSAPWLDLILDTFKKLRSGIRPADMLVTHPELLKEIPWLNEYRSRETLALPYLSSLTLERDGLGISSGIGLHGSREGDLGERGEMLLADSLDTWLPEARGSSARVFRGYLKASGKEEEPVAIKVMRPDQTAYALPLFREEVQILTILHDVSGVTPLLECGFIQLDEGIDLPGEERRGSASGLRGRVRRYGVDSIQSFLASIEKEVERGSLPYLALPQQDPKQNLMAYCDASHTRGQFLPLRESLFLAIQICDILQKAHDRNIVYRDHKILHYYWEPEMSGVTSIDWNIAKRYPEGLGTAEKQFDLVQFGARALHHILTGRAAPGALPLGPNRPEEIEQASHSYHTQWTYDDERLPNQVKEILERALVEGYSQAKDLRKDLYEVYQQLAEAVTE